MAEQNISVENVEYSMLKRGDHVAVKGTMDGKPYYHHGIFLSHTAGVAHYGHVNQTEARVQIIDLFYFMGGGAGVRNIFRVTHKGARSGEEAAKTAEYLADRSGSHSVYDILNNNCEHFATKCKTGKALTADAKQTIDKCIDDAIPLIKKTTLATCPEHKVKH